MLGSPLFESYRKEMHRERIRRWAMRLVPTLAILAVLTAGAVYHGMTRGAEQPQPLFPQALPLASLTALQQVEGRSPTTGTGLPEGGLHPGEGELLDRLHPMTSALAVPADVAVVAGQPVPTHVRVVLPRNGRLKNLLLDQGIAEAESELVVKALAQVQDLRRLQAGQTVELWRGPDGQPDRMLLRPEPLRIVEVVQDCGKYVGRERKLEARTEVARVQGTIETSLGAAVAKVGEKSRLANLLAEFFAGEIEFATQARQGDQFRVLVEKIMVEGDFLRYGRILAAEYKGSRVRVRAFAYVDAEGRRGVFDEQGKSLERLFLRSPMPGHRITSGYSPNRFHPVYKRYLPHRGVDYAGSTGDPILAVADGTVEFAGPKGPNGLLLALKHDQGYTSLYAHLHRIATGVKPGATVKQGQVVAVLGNSGVSTGPHLHFGLTRNGGYLDPKECPATRKSSIPVQHMKDFLASIAPLNRDLDQMALSSDSVVGDLMIVSPVH